MKKCPYCKNEVDEGLSKCPTCNRSLRNIPLTPETFEPRRRHSCSFCGKSVNEVLKVQNKDCCLRCFSNLREKVIVTTTHSIEGFEITEYVNIESAEVVLGTGALSEWITSVQDSAGSRSTIFESKLAQAKSSALLILKSKAAVLGAGAIVGIAVGYTEFTSNRIGVIISGTCVKIRKIGSES